MNIKVDDLSVVFHTQKGDVKAVDSANITFVEGEATGIIGETGSGKSVLGLAILDLLQGDVEVSGRVLLGDKCISQSTDRAMSNIRGREIAFIAQNPGTSLNPSIKVGKQIEEVFKVQEISGNIRQMAIALLEKMGFKNPQEVYSSYGFELSGGMRQRVLIAIAMASRAKWIIADEPTKGLDAIVRGQIYNSLKAVKNGGGSFLLITHDLVLAKKFCDKIIVMYCGHIIEEGPCKDVFLNPKHPYTKDLIESLPQKGMKAMVGFAPAFTNLPKGCLFAPRCKSVKSVCINERPKVWDVLGSKVRCHEYNRD